MDLVRPTLVTRDRELAALVKSLLPFRALADQIEACWSKPNARESRTWLAVTSMDVAATGCHVARGGKRGSPPRQFWPDAVDSCKHHWTALAHPFCKHGSQLFGLSTTSGLRD